MGAAINVGEVYVQLVRDLRECTYTKPGFEHALHNARLIDTVKPGIVTLPFGIPASSLFSFTDLETQLVAQLVTQCTKTVL